MPRLDPGQAGASPTVGSAVRDWTRQLASAGIEGAGGDVRRLVAGALSVSAADVLRAPERGLTTAELQLLQGYVERRRQHEPVSRILGVRDFYGRARQDARLARR